MAVKVLKSELVPFMGGDRFAREMRITSQLRHPGIVALLQTGHFGKRRAGRPRQCVLLVIDAYSRAKVRGTARGERTAAPG